MKIKGNLKILVIEDVTVMKKIYDRYLNQIGLKTILNARNSDHALDILQTEQIDLIISDRMISGIDGLDLLKIVRESDHWKEIPFLMVTSKGEPEEITKAVREGITDYLIKPLAPKTFENKVKKILRLK